MEITRVGIKNKMDKLNSDVTNSQGKGSSEGNTKKGENPIEEK